MIKKERRIITALAIGAGAALLGTGFSIEQGLSQEHKANQIKKNLKDPVFNIPPEFYQNREIARQMAVQGLPQAVINDQNNRINQNQAGAIQGLNRSDNPGAAVSGVVRQGDAAGQTLAAEDAQARENNQRYFIQQNSQLGQEQEKKQQSDVFDKYTRDFNQMQADKGAGLQNLNTGFQDLTSLGAIGLNYASNNPSSKPNYKNINGQWHQQDMYGKWQPVIGSLPSAHGTGVSNPIQTTLPGSGNPRAYLNLPDQYNMFNLKVPPYVDPYFPNVTQ